MKSILRAFKRVLASLSRRVKRIEDQQLLSDRETQRKLDLILVAFKPETMLALDNLAETVASVQRHDQWIRSEEERRRISGSTGAH